MKKRKIPNLITVLILTLITVIMWISLSVYRALSQEPPSSVPEEIANPLTPNLDTKTLNDVQSRIFLDDSQIPEAVVATPPPATPVTLATPTPIPSSTPATDSGTTQ
jgi:hypothetical protein